MVHGYQVAKKVEAGGSTEEPSRTSQVGIDLIKSFEGCELTAYVDAVGVLTIGYGHTGADVYAGQTITQEDAEDLLRKDLQWFEKQVVELSLIHI